MLWRHLLVEEFPMDGHSLSDGREDILMGVSIRIEFVIPHLPTNS